jgi:hypothetical protein
LFITSARFNQLSRRIRQQLSIPDVAVIGGYHGVNLGDMALGISVRRQLQNRNISSGLQTIYNLEKWKWPLTNFAILGGGACGYNSALEPLYNRYKTKLEKVALLGVDFNENHFSQKSRALLSACKWISCRSIEQAQSLRSATQREDIQVHPDLAFSLSFDEMRPLNHYKIGKPVFLMNVVPLYGKIVNNQIIRNQQYQQERTSLYESWPVLYENYRTYVRKLAQIAIEQGYRVETISFSPLDELAAKIILNQLPVSHNPYSDNLTLMVKKMSLADLVFATRYHATIFTLKLGLYLIPFAYAKKNEHLLNFLNIPKSHYFTPEDLITDQSFSHDLTCVNYDHQQIKTLETEAVDYINVCLNTLGLRHHS